MAVEELAIEYKRPPLFDYQRAIIDCPARYTFTEASTKVGKSASHLVWIFEQPLALDLKESQSVWWVAPVYAQAEIMFRRLKAQVSEKGFLKFNESKLIAVYPSGAMLQFKSAEKPDNLYGDDVYAAVFDEFPRAREEAWHALRSTLTATGGKCKFIGNVKGKKNWGHKLAMRAKAGQDADYAYFKITAYDAAAAGMMTKDGRPFLEEIEAAKRDLPENVFNELYLAEPSEDGSNPFGLKHIAACCVPDLSNQPSICYGVDLGRKIDSTSIIGLDKLGFMSHYDNFVRRSWPHVTDTIKYLPNKPMVMDGTGVGDAILAEVELVQSQAEGYIFTQASKQRLMEGLAVGLQSRRIHIADDGNVTGGTGKLRHQLEQFEVIYTRTGVKYSAPEGDHDDDVCSLALAYYKWQQTAVMGDEVSVY